MAKVQLLLDVVEDIRSLADSLEAVADAMTCSEDVPTQRPMANEPKLTPVDVSPSPESHDAVEKPIQKEELRAFLGELSLKGHRDALQTIICKYGVLKFNDVDPKYYAAIKKEAEALENAT